MNKISLINIENYIRISYSISSMQKAESTRTFGASISELSLLSKSAPLKFIREFSLLEPLIRWSISYSRNATKYQQEKVELKFSGVSIDFNR